MAISGAAVFGIVNTIDSHLLSRRMPGLLSYLLPVGIIFLVFSLVMFYFYPMPTNTDLLPLMAAIGAGILRTSGVVITLYNLQKEEVSRVMPITHTIYGYRVLSPQPLPFKRNNYSTLFK